MTSKQKIFAVIVSILIVMMIDHFFLHVLFPIKRAHFMKEISHEVEESLVAHPPVDDTSTPLPPATEEEKAKLVDFKTAAQDCLGGTWSSHLTIADELEKTYGVQSKAVDIENFHLRNPQGEERRIHIIQEAPEKKQVRYFSVDEQGLPVPIVLTSEQRNMDPEKLIEHLKAQGTVFYHQTKEHWLLGNGASFMATVENGKIQEFQVFGLAKTLSCLENSCQCL